MNYKVEHISTFPEIFFKWSFCASGLQSKTGIAATHKSVGTLISCFREKLKNKTSILHQ